MACYIKCLRLATHEHNKYLWNTNKLRIYTNKLRIKNNVIHFRAEYKTVKFSMFLTWFTFYECIKIKITTRYLKVIKKQVFKSTFKLWESRIESNVIYLRKTLKRIYTYFCMFEKIQYILSKSFCVLIIAWSGV